MDEAINYKALYEQVQGDLERLKLDMWASKQRGSMARVARIVYHALLSRLTDMTAVEIIAGACILSLALHYHYRLARGWRND